jgi:hypothetical protein
MIKYNTLVCPGAGAGAETSVYRLQLRLRPKVSAPAGSGSATLFASSTYLPEGSQHPLIIGQKVFITLQSNCQMVLENLY